MGGSFIEVIPCPSCGKEKGGIEIHTEKQEPPPAEATREWATKIFAWQENPTGSPRPIPPLYGPLVRTVSARKDCQECQEKKLAATSHLDFLTPLWEDAVKVDDNACAGRATRKEAKEAWMVLTDALEENAGTESSMYVDAKWALARWDREGPVEPLQALWLRSI